MSTTTENPDRFTGDEVAILLLSAFQGATHRAGPGGPMGDKRLGYLRGYSQSLLSNMASMDVDTGHLTWPEAVALLVGAALAAQVLHCRGEEPTKELCDQSD